jgi:hypothetical protein
MKAKPEIAHGCTELYGYWIHCLGCNTVGDTSKWHFNGNLNYPTFTPSHQLAGKTTRN